MLTDEQIFDILDGQASKEILQAHKDLMLNSLTYQRYFKELEAMHFDLADMPLEHTSSNFTENVLASIVQEKSVSVIVKRKAWAGKLLFVFFGIMISLFIVTIISLLSYSSPVEMIQIRPNLIPKGFKDFLTQDFTKVAVLANLIILLVLFDKRVLRPYFKHRRITLG